jgi:hypothetical protein
MGYFSVARDHGAITPEELEEYNPFTFAEEDWIKISYV